MDGAPKAAAFTLIELLVVIAIIAILAGLLIQTAGYVQEKAGRARAEAEIKALSTGLESYKLDFGTYPQQAAKPDNSDTDESTKVLLDALDPTTDGQKIYFEIPTKMLNSYPAQTKASEARDKADYLVDPFGNAYHYQFPGNPERSGEAFFDLWTKGKKGVSNTNTASWIKNW